jgi:primosomal protein N''
MNHPSRKLLGHIAKQMHQLLGVKPEQNNNQYEYLGESILPIYRAVSRHLSFDGVENVKMRGKVLSIQDYIARHIDVYRQIDGAKLKHNLLYVKKQGEAIFKELITAV